VLGFSFFQDEYTIPITGGEDDLMIVGLDVHKRVCYGTVMD